MQYQPRFILKGNSLTTIRKSWADRQHIKTGVIGEIVDGVRITEDNRVSVFEFWSEGIEILQKIVRENYKRKNVNAVLFGIQSGQRQPSHKYAIYASDEFLHSVRKAMMRYIEEHGEDYGETIH